MLANVLLVLWVLSFGAAGFFRGLAAQMLSFVGIVAGVIAGAAVAPHVLAGGDDSTWVPLASFVGASVGAVLFGLGAGRLAGGAHVALARHRALLLADRIGGALAGGLVGLALAWAAAVVLLHQPAFGLRHEMQRSELLAALVEAVPPEPVLRTLERFDPLPVLPQLAPGRLPPPDPSVLRSSGAERAADSVLKVEGTSCGLGVQGSGWVLRRGLVATNAHVVAGQSDTRVFVPGSEARDATVVYVDGTNDVALLRVAGLSASPLDQSGDGEYPRPAVLLGYPQDGPLTATAVTAGAPRTVIAPNAYETRVAPRQIVPLRGRVQPGESGGPVVDERGRVVAMVFGGARDGGGGFAVPLSLVLRGLDRPLRPVSAGPCVG